MHRSRDFFSRVAIILSLIGFTSVVGASTVSNVSGGGSLFADFGDNAGVTEFSVTLDNNNPIWIDLSGSKSSEDFDMVIRNPTGVLVTSLELKFINENGGVLPAPLFVFNQISHTTPSVSFSLDSAASTDGDIVMNVAGVTPGIPGNFNLSMFMTNFGEGDWSLGIGINGADLNTVPLPAPIWLFGSSLVGLLAYRKKIEK